MCIRDRLFSLPTLISHSLLLQCGSCSFFLSSVIWSELYPPFLISRCPIFIAAASGWTFTLFIKSIVISEVSYIIQAASSGSKSIIIIMCIIISIIIISTNMIYCLSLVSVLVFSIGIRSLVLSSGSPVIVLLLIAF